MHYQVSRDWKQDTELLEQLQTHLQQGLHERKYVRTRLRDARSAKSKPASRFPRR